MLYFFFHSLTQNKHAVTTRAISHTLVWRLLRLMIRVTSAQYLICDSNTASTVRQLWLCYIVLLRVINLNGAPTGFAGLFTTLKQTASLLMEGGSPK